MEERFIPYYVTTRRRIPAVYRWDDESKMSASKIAEFMTFEEAHRAKEQLNREYLLDV